MDEGWPQNVNGSKLGSHLEAQNAHKVSGNTANWISRNASCKGGTAKDFGCLSCETQEKRCCLPLCSQYDNSLLKFQQKEPSDPGEAIDTAQKFRWPIRDEGHKITPGNQCPKKVSSESPLDKGFISSNKTSTDVPPFEFHVRSDEGINLFVDLNSSPSDWIKSLKNEVCIYPEVQKSKSWALQLELKGLGDANEQIETSLLGNEMAGIQTISGSTHAVPSSMMREEDQGGVHHSDGDGLLGFVALKSMSTPLEITEYPDERNYTVSLSCKSYPHIKNVNLSAECSSKGSERADTCIEVHDASQFKSAGRYDAQKGIDLPGPQSKSGAIFLENTDSVSMGTSSISQQTGLPPSCEVILPSTVVTENSSGVCLGCSTSSSMEMQFSEAASQCEDTSNFPDLNGGVLPYSDNKIGKLQAENGRSPEYALDKNTGEGPTSECPEEQGGNNVINEAESSECSQIDNFLVRASKRSQSSEDDGLQSKRQNRHREDDIRHSKPATRNAKNGNELVREGFRRRSMRLVSKHLGNVSSSTWNQPLPNYCRGNTNQPEES